MKLTVLCDLGLTCILWNPFNLKGGNHSCCMSITASPSIASIIICANWKIPGVMNRYIHCKSAGDQWVCRSVSGQRHLMSKRFAESCPYFDFSECEETEKMRFEHALDEWIKAQMTAGGYIIDGVFLLFKHWLASFIYHREWLDENIHSNNALKWSFFGQAIPCADLVGPDFPFNKTVDTPKITGLPVNVLYIAKVERLNIELAELKHVLLFTINISSTKHSLDMRSVCGEGYSLLKEIDYTLNDLYAHGNLPAKVPWHFGYGDDVMDQILEAEGCSGYNPVEVMRKIVLSSLLSIVLPLNNSN